MSEIEIEPGAAETLAEDADNDEFAAWLQDKADEGETFSMPLPKKSRDRLLVRAIIWQIRDNLDEVENDYKRGKLEGKVETLELILNQTEELVWKND
jgi:hypothetical protein